MGRVRLAAGTVAGERRDEWWRVPGLRWSDLAECSY